MHSFARALCSALIAVCAGAMAPPVSAADSKAAVPPDQTTVQVETAKPDASPRTEADVLRTRFIVGLARKVDCRIFSLSNPNRVVVEIPDTDVRLPALEKDQVVGLVKSIRAGLAAPGHTRVVIGVTHPAIVESSRISRDREGRFRLALIIRPAGKANSGQRADAIQPPLPRPAENPKERAAKAFRPVIVLDPGHGGKDSGAVKANTIEKNVVLAFGLELRKQLEKTGRYRVYMTRDDDTFVTLDGRLEFADQHKANLFIAIHADYARSGARGATIYTLRDRVAKHLERSARDRAADRKLSDSEIELVKKISGNVSAVRNILADLAERDVGLTHERTSVFAKTVIENMSEQTLMRSDPDKQAAFRVLKTAQFPSVLIELAYVTNQKDAKNLHSDEWREKVAQSIVTAIDNYFSNEIARLPM